MDIVKQWKKTHHPNLKLKNYLAHRGLWDEEKETALVKSVDADVKVSRMVKLFRDVIHNLVSYRHPWWWLSRGLLRIAACKWVQPLLAG